MMIGGIVLSVAACSKKAPPPVVPLPVPVEPPLPAAAPGIPDDDVNSGIGPEEALWHIRAGLNVAALSCGNPNLIARYNALLIEQKALFADAYKAEQTRYGTQPGALDAHMTRVYNFFAKPVAQSGLCAAASKIATAPAGGLEAATATATLDALRRPILMPPAMAMAARVGLTAAGASQWRIQIGAFTGQSRAEAAWLLARTRVPSLASFTPRYDPVPASPLVRVQIGPATDRDDAIRMCAAAAAGGFDCLPLPADRTRD